MIQYGSIPFAIALILSINSLLASNIGTTVGAARILYNLAREKAAPKIFTKVNKQGEPILTTLIAGISTAIIVILSVQFLGITAAFSEVAAVEGVLWILGRIFDGFGVPLFYWRINGLKLRYIIIPIIATLMNGWGEFESILSMDYVQIAMLSIFAILVISWYILKASKGYPGSLVVDENNELMTIEEYLRKVISR